MSVNWPASVVPKGQTFYAGGEAISGGRTLGGVPVMSPEPGGWGTLDLAFNAFGGVAPRLISWLLSAVRNGRVFTIPIVISPQLVPAVDLGGEAGQDYFTGGTLWSNDEPWSSDLPWAYEPVAEVDAAASEGAAELTIDMSPYGQVLWHGHVIGEGQHAYKVDEIDYDDDVATVTVTPPLRRALTTSSLIKFRPTMTGICTDPSRFEALFEPGGIIRPGTISFTEVVETDT